jgi:hypothetical protein
MTSQVNTNTEQVSTQTQKTVSKPNYIVEISKYNRDEGTSYQPFFKCTKGFNNVGKARKWYFALDYDSQIILLKDVPVVLPPKQKGRHNNNTSRVSGGPTTEGKLVSLLEAQVSTLQKEAQAAAGKLASREQAIVDLRRRNAEQAVLICDLENLLVITENSHAIPSPSREVSPPSLPVPRN